MSNLLQAAIPVMIPAAVAVLVAYQGAISRTGRLRRNVKADVEVLAALPAEHPSREGLEGHVGELVDELIRREQLHYFPVGRLGWGFVMVVAVTLAIAGAAVILALAATGTVVVRGVPPRSPGGRWWCTLPPPSSPDG